MPARQLIFDTETTGFDPYNGDRIVEIGVVELVGRKPTGQQVHLYINPERDMPEEAYQIHGLSAEFLADKSVFGEVAKALYDFMAGAELIAHNADFDMKFLLAEFEKAGLAQFAALVSVIDTLAIAKKHYPGQRNTLDALVKRLGVAERDRTLHGALLDSEILADVYLALTGGQVALEIDDTPTNEQRTEAHADSLDNLQHLLVASLSDISADTAWRASVLAPVTK